MLKNIIADPQLPRIHFKLKRFKSTGPKVREVSDENLNEDEKLLHEVDKKQCDSAISSRNIRTAEQCTVFQELPER